jgi:hypothetical protein
MSIKPTENQVNSENTIRLMRKILQTHLKIDCNISELMLELILGAMKDSLSLKGRHRKSGNDFLQSVYFTKLCEILQIEPKWLLTKWKHYETIYWSYQNEKRETTAIV